MADTRAEARISLAPNGAHVARARSDHVRGIGSAGAIDVLM
ncbi:hypothetical protein [Streptomyces chartreusis]